MTKLERITQEIKEGREFVNHHATMAKSICEDNKLSIGANEVVLKMIEINRNK